MTRFGFFLIAVSQSTVLFQVLYLRADRSDTVAQLKAKISGYASTEQMTIHDVVLRTEWNYPVEQYTGTVSARQDVPKHTKPEGIRLYMQVGS